MRKKLGLKTTPITLKEGCEKHCESCKQRNLRDATIKHYRESYKVFYRYYGEDMLLSKMTQSKYNEFSAYLRTVTNSDKMNVFKLGYFYDVDTNTLHLSKAFERKTLQYGSDEFKLVRKLREVCPDMKVEIHTREGKAKPLSYEMMKKFIRLLPTAEADLKEME